MADLLRHLINMLDVTLANSLLLPGNYLIQQSVLIIADGCFMQKGKLRGDVGDAEALTTFALCKHGVEYRYCITNCSRPSKSVASDRDMAQMKPQNIIQADSSYTVKSTSMASSDCGLKKVSSEVVASNLSTKRPHDPKEFTDGKKFCKGARGNWHEKAVGKGKTKYLWTNEVKNMPSEGKRGEPARVPPVSSKPLKSVASDHNMGRMKLKSIIHEDSSYMVKSNSKFGPSKHSEKLHPTRSGNTQNNASVQKVKELKSIFTPVDEHCQMKQTSAVNDIETSHAKKQKEMGETASASQMSRISQTCDDPQTDATLSPAVPLVSTEVIKRTNGHLQKKTSKEPCANCLSPMSGVELSKDAKPKNSEAGNVVFTVKEFYIKAAAEEPLPTDPATIASWIGSFILKDEKTSIGFQAHPTSRGLSKVKEFSKKMPEVLKFELCLYEDFLRNVFKGCDPDDKDIGLYFFPDDRNRPNAYISHLEQLSENFFLRSCINGVELLVFTSKVLHKDYLKRNKCDFLWGIYRRRHGKLKGAEEEKMVVDMDIDSEEVDMEVDMIGGEIVGTVDVVVPKLSIESNIDIPPGFSPSMRGQWMMKIKTEVL